MTCFSIAQNSYNYDGVTYENAEHLPDISVCNKLFIIPVFIFLLLVLFVSVVGNIMIIRSVYIAKRRTNVHIFKLFLGIADLFFAHFYAYHMVKNIWRFAVHPMTINQVHYEMSYGKHNSFMDYNETTEHHGSPSWEKIEMLNLITRIINVNASKLSEWMSVQIVFMATMDRAFSMKAPFLHKTHITKDRVTTAIIINWSCIFIYTVYFNYLSHTVDGMKIWYQFAPERMHYDLTYSGHAGPKVAAWDLVGSIVFWVIPWISIVGMNIYIWVQGNKVIKRTRKPHIYTYSAKTSLSTVNGGNSRINSIISQSTKPEAKCRGKSVSALNRTMPMIIVTYVAGTSLEAVLSVYDTRVST